MKSSLSSTLKRIFLGTSLLFPLLGAGQALSFPSLLSNQPINSENFVVVASQLAANRYKMNVLEQIPDKRLCWEEYGEAPTQINPLLLTFDFTEDCRRYNSNGYSVQGLGQDSQYYRLRVRTRQQSDASGASDEVLVLEAWQPFNKNVPAVEVGRAKLTENTTHVKIELNSDWSLMQRVVDGESVNHIYFSQVSDEAQSY